MYKDLFINRWKEMEKSIILEREDGETTFLENEVFHKFFISPELLVGFYIWRGDYGINDGYELFMEEYDGWTDDCKEIAIKAKEIFEREITKQQFEGDCMQNNRIVSAMKAAGYELDETDSCENMLVFVGDYCIRMKFDSYDAVEEWLEGVVFDDPEISNNVEKIMHPDRFVCRDKSK